MTNLENLNAYLIRQGIPQPERMTTLRDLVINQLETLSASNGAKKLNAMQDQGKLPG